MAPTWAGPGLLMKTLVSENSVKNRLFRASTKCRASYWLCIVSIQKLWVIVVILKQPLLDYQGNREAFLEPTATKCSVKLAHSRSNLILQLTVDV